VARALEELVIEELDTLYRGALFLSAGDRRRADALLHDTATAAYRAGARQGRLVGPQPLERMMIGCFREQSASSGIIPPTGERTAAPSGWDGRLTPDARAALWLVAIRRWSYGDVAMLLRVDQEGLEGLLAYRDAFMSEALRSSRIPNARKAE